MIPPMWQFIKFCLIVLRAGLIQSGSGHLLLLLHSSPGVGVPRLIGIGGSLTAPPLPHHRTYGSRIRRFGSLSIITMPRRSPQALRLPSQARSGMGTHRPEELPFTTVQAFPDSRCQVLCPLLTAAGRSERLSPPSANFRGTPLPRASRSSPGVSLNTVCA
jgi:hypothetical protein